MTLENKMTFNILRVFLQKKNLKISVNSIKKELLQHPNFPSTASIVDAFSAWRIENMVLNIGHEKNKINELPMPFIGDLNSNYVIVENVNDTQIQYTDEKTKQHTVARDKFLADWSGIAVLTFPNEASGEENYTLNHFLSLITQYRIVLVGLLAVLSLAYLAYDALFLSVFALFCIKIIGIVVSSLLVAHELDGSDSVVNKVCTGIKSDCNKVLKSERSKLFGFISWADLGLVYFAGGAVALLFVWQNPTSLMWFLKIINLSALLFIPYSIWYQYKIAREWCYFCLCILGLFVVEGVLLNVTNNGFIAAFLPNIAALFLAFAGVIAGLLYLKPLLLENANNRKRIATLQTTKYQPQIFQSALNTGRFLPKTPENMAFRYGEPDAANIIALITNPYCGFCGEAHTMIEEYLNGYFDNLTIEIIITPPQDENSDSYKIAYTLMETYQNDPEKALQLMHEWYTATDKGASWLSKHALPITNANIKQVLAVQRIWLDEQKVDYTPFVAYNSQEVDAKFGYTIRDLRYFFE